MFRLLRLVYVELDPFVPLSLPTTARAFSKISSTLTCSPHAESLTEFSELVLQFLRIAVKSPNQVLAQHGAGSMSLSSLLFTALHAMSVLQSVVNADMCWL